MSGPRRSAQAPTSEGHSVAVEIGRRAFLQACALDVGVPKPGNVSLVSAGHGMQAAQFIASAQAASLALCVPGRAVGLRIEAAVAASLREAGCNTNLGILLLAAPLLAAAEQPGALAGLAPLQQALQQVLASLDGADAAAVFRAIAQASPGGLGDAPQQDVRRAPTTGLVEAMALAAGHDSVARQYAAGYADVFDLAQPLMDVASAGAGTGVLDWPADDPARPSPATVQAVQQVFLACLRRWPDSHIQRKQGLAVARQVQAQARRLSDLLPPSAEALAAWDVALKAAGLNPGTSADLTVATLLAAGMLLPAA